jgi:hypothetical protein
MPRLFAFLLLFDLCLLPASGAGQSSAPDGTPGSLQVPAGETLRWQAHGVGDQIYTCQAAANGNFSWALSGPDAELQGSKGEPLGRHFHGPAWQANDGSKIEARMSASAASPDATSIPWLLLKVTEHSGQGVLSKVEHVQRLRTAGGKAPANGCDREHAGKELRVPYQADYLFWGPAQ